MYGRSRSRARSRPARGSAAAPAWTPASLGSLALWLRVENDAAVTTVSGGFASATADKSGNGRHYSQATGSRQPAFNASDADFNGQPSLTNDTTDDCLTGPAPIDAQGAATLILVARVTSEANGGVIGSASGSAPNIIMHVNGTGIQCRFNNTNVATPLAGVGTTTGIFVAVFDGSGGAGAGIGTVYRNKLQVSQLTTLAATLTSATTWAVGSYASTFSTAMKWTEVIATRSVMTADEWSQVHSYLSSRYAITLEA
jgi:hypothetical protein